MNNKLNKILLRMIEDVRHNDHSYCNLADRWEREILAELGQNPLQPIVIHWHTRKWKPGKGKQILIFSPVYPEGHSMRKRIIDSTFFDICQDATHWSDIEEPNV